MVRQRAWHFLQATLPPYISRKSPDQRSTADVNASGPGGAFLEGVSNFKVPGEDPVELDLSATGNFFQSSITGFSEVIWGDWEADMIFEPSQFAHYQIKVVTADDKYVLGADLY